jgi:acetyltransferase-like isoleucine patch superfamily enzyme
MKAELKSLIKRLEAGYPRAGALARRASGLPSSHGVRFAIKGERNAIHRDGALLRRVFFDIRGRDNIIDIGRGSELVDVVFHVVGSGHRILIERDCIFSNGAMIWFEDRDCVLSVGRGSTFVEVHLALTEPGARMTIGRDCMFANDIDVRTGDSHSILARETGERINYAEDVCIGDHVWVGAHSVLLKGTHIAHDSVVAAGSIVTGHHDLPGVVLGGNPARSLQEGVTWRRERIYQGHGRRGDRPASSA